MFTQYAMLLIGLGAVLLGLVGSALLCYCRRALRKEMDGLARELDDEEKRIESGLYSEGRSVPSSSCASIASDGETCTVSISVGVVDGDCELDADCEESEMCALEETMRALMWAKHDQERGGDEDEYESMATASLSDVRQNNLLLLSPQSAWRGNVSGEIERDCDSETSVSVMTNESESSCPVYPSA